MRSSLNRCAVVPAREGAFLHSAEEVVRLPVGRAVSSEESWALLKRFLIAADEDWIQYLKKAPDEASGQPSIESSARFAVARKLLHRLELESVTSWEKIVGKAIRSLFSRSLVSLSDAVKLSHLVAELNLHLPDGFKFITQDRKIRAPSEGLLASVTGEAKSLIPQTWLKKRLLHDDYLTGVDTHRWNVWAQSERSRLSTFAQVTANRERLWNEHDLQHFLHARSVSAPERYALKTRKFEIRDYDFDEELWTHWQGLAQSDPQIWVRVLREIVHAPERFWADTFLADVKQLGNAKEYALEVDETPASWVVHLRDLPCIADVHGSPRQPAELLLRSPDTEPLMGVEPFVEADLDREKTKPLLKALGVRETPASADKLVDRIRALSSSDEPPLHELGKWYDALDRIIARTRPDDLAKIRRHFSSERLILTASEEWAVSGEVFRFADASEFPGVPAIHPGLASLSMWGRLGVAERPTAELILSWLSTLDSGAKLDAQDASRIRGYLQRFPERIWSDCGHWLSLDRSWAPVDRLDLCLSGEIGLKPADLFPPIKARVADLRMISADRSTFEAVQPLRDLSQSITHRITKIDLNGSRTLDKPWLKSLAEHLQRVRLDDDERMGLLRSEAFRLARSRWQPFDVLKVTPYLDGVPAGLGYSPDVLWVDDTIYVRDVSLPHILGSLVKALSQPFALPSVTESIKVCVDREPEFISEYLEYEFALDEFVDSPALSGVERKDESNAPDQLPLEQSFTTETETTQEAEPPVRYDIKGPEDSQSESHDDPSPKTGDGDAADFNHFEPLQILPTESRDEQDPVAPPSLVPEEAAPSDNSELADEPPVKKERIPLIDRYARVHGFHWQKEREAYVHPDGRVILRATGMFRWEIWSADHQLERKLLVSDQCLTKQAYR